MAAEAPDKDLADPLIGQLLGSRYLIELKLGEGAMGAVYRARHVKVGRPFAVKALHRRLLEDRKVALRFEREAELAGRLHHPNVIGVVDVGETPDGVRYMVMDYVEGSDLSEVLTEAPFPPERIIHLVRQLLEGLYHAHEAGLIHRDFKPENVLVERDDHGREVPRIADFGISILREGGESTDGTGRLTTNGLVLGTPHYMAPEQAVADPIDHRIDLFAMGIVIYEMLSGRLPFDGAGAEVARANLLLDPPPISKRVPYLEVDPLLEAFARRLMAKKRDHRPATAKKARELLDLIERDRAAAAAALGVPIEVGTRAPNVTQPVGPQPAAHATHETSPARRMATPGDAPRPPSAGPRPSELEAPPVQRPQAAPPERVPTTQTEAAPTPKADGLRTTMAEPLPWSDERPASSRRRWLIAVGAGLAPAGVIVALALASSGGDDAKPSAGQPTSMTAAPEPAPAPAPTPPPPPESEAAGRAAVPATPDPPAGAGSAAEVQPPADPGPGSTGSATDSTKPAPGSTRPDRTRTRPNRRPDPSAIKPGPDPTRPDPTRPDPTRPDAVKPDAAKPDAVKPDAAKPGTSSSEVDVYQRWEQVRAAINALKASPATRAEGDRLYGRLSRIQIQTAQLDPKARKDALAELAELEKLIAAARSKP